MRIEDEEKRQMEMDEDERVVRGYINGTMLTSATFVVLTVISFFFSKHSSDPTLNIAMLYTLGIFFITRYTRGQIFGIVFSVISVLSMNYFFTYPYLNLNFSLDGYQVAFIGMLMIAIITSVMSSKMRDQANKLIEQEKEIARQQKMVLEGEKEKMRANLLRAVSHDLRTPLTGILGNTRTLLEMYGDLDDEEKMEIIKSIDDDADWLLNMVENLLTVTRINNDTATVKKSLEAVDEVVSAAVLKFKKRFPEMKVNVKLPDDIVMAEMDAILVQQVIINILQNAAMHSKSDRPIEFFIYEKENLVEFHIRDYGIGISKDRVKTIFDAEGTGKSSASADGFKGMGIGLSICKTIVLAHDGQIWAVYHDDGAEFVFTLPSSENEKPDMIAECDF